MVKKFKWQMKEYFFDPKYPICINGFLATFQLAFDTNRIQEGAAMWLLPDYVNETVANELNNLICATDKHSFIAASVRNVDIQSRKLLRSYPIVVSYLLKKLATDRALA